VQEETRLRRFALAALFALAGCAEIQPVVAPTSAADPNAAYISGTFTHARIQGFAFVIRSGEGKEYFMSLGEDAKVRTEIEDQVVAIKVPPGSYAVTHWITYAPASKAVELRMPIQNTVLEKPFTVKPGDVVHLGVFDIAQAKRGDMNYYQILPYVGPRAQMQTALAHAYPNLAASPFRCVLCR
jgi:hypothetical protein